MSGTRAWWLCPNEPRCPHARVFHDTYDDEDEVPRCCAEDCDCGKVLAPASGTLTMAAVIARWWRSLDRTGRGVTLGGVLATALLAWWLIADWHSYWAQYVATNVLPPSLWTLVGIAIAHLQLHRKLDANHQDMKQHVTERTGQ